MSTFRSTWVLVLAVLAVTAVFGVGTYLVTAHSPSLGEHEVELGEEGTSTIARYDALHQELFRTALEPQPLGNEATAQEGSITVHVVTQERRKPIKNFVLQLVTDISSTVTTRPITGSEYTSRDGKVVLRDTPVKPFALRALPRASTAYRSDFESVDPREGKTELWLVCEPVIEVEFHTIDAQTGHNLPNSTIDLIHPNTFGRNYGVLRPVLELSTFVPFVDQLQREYLLDRVLTDKEGKGTAYLPRGTSTLSIRATHPTKAIHENRRLRVGPELRVPIPLTNGGIVECEVIPSEGLPQGLGLCLIASGSGSAGGRHFYPTRLEKPTGAQLEGQRVVRLKQVFQGAYDVVLCRSTNIFWQPLATIDVRNDQVTRARLDLTKHLAGQLRVTLLNYEELKDQLVQPFLKVYRKQEDTTLARPYLHVRLENRFATALNLLPGDYRVCVDGDLRTTGTYVKLYSDSWIHVDPASKVNVEVNAHRYPVHLLIHDKTGKPVAGRPVRLRAGVFGDRTLTSDENGRIYLAYGPADPFVVSCGAITRILKPQAAGVNPSLPTIIALR